MKKIIACVFAFVMVLSCFTACGKQQEEQPAEESSSVPEMKFHESEIGKTEEPKVKSFTYDVDVKPNMSDDAELGFIRMIEPEDADEYREPEYDENGEEITPAPFKEKNLDITDLTEDEFAKELAVSKCKLTSLNLKSQGFLFSGRGYVWYENPDELSSYGTVIYLESYNDVLNAAKSDDASSTDDETADITEVYTKDKGLIKAICVTNEFLGHDFELSFYGDIKLGDERTAVEKKLGSGTEMANKPKGTDVVYYKNEKNTLVCVYLSEDEEGAINFDEENAGKLIEVVVINNDNIETSDESESSDADTTSAETTTTTAAATTATSADSDASAEESTSSK